MTDKSCCEKCRVEADTQIPGGVMEGCSNPSCPYCHSAPQGKKSWYDRSTGHGEIGDERTFTTASPAPQGEDPTPIEQIIEEWKDGKLYNEQTLRSALSKLEAEVRREERERMRDIASRVNPGEFISDDYERGWDEGLRAFLKATKPSKADNQNEKDK